MKKFDLKNLQGSKRTLRSGSYATVLAVVVLAFVILVNLVVQALPSKWTEFDISTSSLFTLSDTSKNLLHELNSDVTAYYLAESGQEDTNITRLLDRYADESSHAGRSWNSTTSTTAPAPNTPKPTGRLLQSTPTSTATMSSTTKNTMSASRLPLVNMVLMPFIR